MRLFPLRSKLVPLALLLGLLLAILLPTSAAALANPDVGWGIIEARIYRNLWEDGDFLAVIEYDLAYAIPPGAGEPADEYFLAGIWLSGVKGPDRALNYYQVNFTSIYLTADQVIDYGYDNYTEVAGGYQLRIYGNPTHFAPLVEGVDMTTWGIGAGQWIDLSMNSARESLGSWCLDMAAYFDATWRVDLLTLPLR